MTRHFNELSPPQAERLALLAEECGELVQAIGKTLRHGFDSTHPDGGPTNRRSIELECGDVAHAMQRLCTAGDLSQFTIDERTEIKAGSVTRYLHHAD